MNPMVWLTEGGLFAWLALGLTGLAGLWAVWAVRGEDVRVWFDAAVAWAMALLATGNLGLGLGLIQVVDAVAAAGPSLQGTLLRDGWAVARYPLWVALTGCGLLALVVVGTAVARPPVSSERPPYVLRALGAMALLGGGLGSTLWMQGFRGSFALAVSGAPIDPALMSTALFTGVTACLLTLGCCGGWAVVRVGLRWWERRASQPE